MKLILKNNEFDSGVEFLKCRRFVLGTFRPRQSPRIFHVRQNFIRQAVSVNLGRRILVKWAPGMPFEPKLHNAAPVRP